MEYESKRKRHKPQHAHGWGYGGLWYCGGSCDGHGSPPVSACDNSGSDQSGGDSGGSTTAGKGKPRTNPTPPTPTPTATETPDSAADSLDPERKVIYHRAVDKDMKRLDGPTRKAAQDAIEGIRTGDPLIMHQTHPMTAGSALDGWYSTKVSRGHRIIHRPTDDGHLEVGYVGLHEYGQAIRRLSVLAEHRYRDIHEGGGHGFIILHDQTRTASVGVSPTVRAELVYGVDHRRKRIFINALNVHEDYRGEGLATQLVVQAMRQWRGYDVDPGVTSEAGEKWWRGAAPYLAHLRSQKLI